MGNSQKTFVVVSALPPGNPCVILSFFSFLKNLCHQAIKVFLFSFSLESTGSDGAQGRKIGATSPSPELLGGRVRMAVASDQTVRTMYRERLQGQDQSWQSG
jgi:hypothetical protein